MDKLKITFPIIVEGKYDIIKIRSVADATVVSTDGFGVFKNSERLALIKRLAERTKIIVLTDSDGAGKVIRSHITQAVPRDRLIQLYIPQVEGKERRKSERSAEGYLGVEGTDADVLRRLLEPFSDGTQSDICECEPVTKTDFFEFGLTGEGSADKREKLAQKLGLPRKMTPNALLAAINVLMTRDAFFELMLNE